MRKILLSFIVLTLGMFDSYSQSCIPTTINGSTITLACGQACAPFTYQVPHLKSTSDYAVTTTPYAAYPNTGGTAIPSIYIDDKYSQLIPMAFPFCFYGQTYTDLIAGSNSLVTFETICANASNAYTLTVGGAPQPLPYAGGAGPTGIATTYYPRTAIMAAYQDIDPSATPLPTRRIEYNVFGTAPCRKFVISFVDVRMFGSSCSNLIHTSQIVLYESTGLIDVFLLNKPLCTSWPSGAGAGLAILGIQDETRTKFAAAPGKNCTQWSEANTGYRFTPNGGTSNFVSAQLFTLAGVFIANADTATTTAGILDITFPAICPPPGAPTTQYVIRTTFNSCTGTPLTSSDTITANRVTTLPANVNTTATTCGVSTGSITVTPTAGTAPYTYTLNGGAPQTAPGAYTFNNLAAGTYTIVATDFTGCTNTFTATVTTTTSIPGNISSTGTSCPLSTDGTITVTPTGGTAPYNYSLDGGPPQASNVFTNVAAGPHTVLFTDAMGCTGTVSITVTAGSTPLTGTISSTPTTCPTLNDGTITVTMTSGTAPYQYRLDGGPPQASNVFTNVAAGPHSVAVTDLYGCTGTFVTNVVQGSGLTSSINGVNPPCSNINDGTITLTPTSGTAPYQYSLNGGPFQPANVFTGLAPGNYTVTFNDAAGCSGTNSVTLTTNPAITATSTLVSPLCNGVSNGSITLNASGGVPPYQYSINAGASYQASPTFAGLAAGTYNFLVKDAAGCIFNFTFNLNEPAVVTASAVNGIASCANNDGTITITASGGTPAYQYSINNGVSYQPGNVFNNIPVGNYNNIKVKDANGCIANTSAVVVLNDTMRLDLGADSTICFGNRITLLPQTNPQTDTFRWTPAAGLDYDTAKNPIASPNDTTKYYLLAKWGICQLTDSITVNILHKPIADAGRDTSICYKTNALLVGNATNLSGAVNYLWSPPDSLNTPNAAITLARIDTTRKFTLTVTDNYGCNFSVSDSMWVIMMPPLVVHAGNDTNAISGRPHQLLGSGGANYVWSPAGPLNNPFIANPLATLYNDTYFTVLVTDAIGCTASDGVFIKVYEGPNYYVPNAFSPNGDGLNDIFRPIPVGIKSTESFRVFDRYGQLMFQTNKWLEGWDGMYKGKNALGGTYVWTIKGVDKNGRVIEMSGTVILVR